MREIQRARDVDLAIGLCQRVLALLRGNALFRGAQARPIFQRQRLKVFEVAGELLILQFAGDVEVRRDGLEAHKLAQGGESLLLSELSRADVDLELQKLELDLQEVAFAYRARLVLIFADAYRILKTLQILAGEIERGFGEQNIGELRGDGERKRSLIVRHSGLGDGRQILRGFQAVLALLAAFKQITYSNVKFGLIDVVGGKVRGLLGQPDHVDSKNGVWPQIGGNLLRLALRDGRARRQQGVIVSQREPDRLIQRDTNGRLHGLRDGKSRNAQQYNHKGRKTQYAVGHFLPQRDGAKLGRTMRPKTAARVLQGRRRARCQPRRHGGSTEMRFCNSGAGTQDQKHRNGPHSDSLLRGLMSEMAKRATGFTRGRGVVMPHASRRRRQQQYKRERQYEDEQSGFAVSKNSHTESSAESTVPDCPIVGQTWYPGNRLHSRAAAG